MDPEERERCVRENGPGIGAKTREKYTLGEEDRP